MTTEQRALVSEQETGFASGSGRPQVQFTTEQDEQLREFISEEPFNKLVQSTGRSKTDCAERLVELSKGTTAATKAKGKARSASCSSKGRAGTSSRSLVQFTPEQDEQIREFLRKEHFKTLAQSVGRSKADCKARLVELKNKAKGKARSASLLSKGRAGSGRPQVQFTPEQDKQFREYILKEHFKTLARSVGRSKTDCRARLAELKKQMMAREQECATAATKAKGAAEKPAKECAGGNGPTTATAGGGGGGDASARDGAVAGASQSWGRTTNSC